MTSSSSLALTYPDIEDSWFSDVVAREIYSIVRMKDNTSRRITIQDISVIRTKAAVTGNGLPLVFKIGGTQVLVQRCSVSGDSTNSFSTGARFTGPNVYLYNKVSGNKVKADPHQRWATGLLQDNLDGDQIFFVNEQDKGTGHGWAIGWGVLWNSKGRRVQAETPPGSMTWVVGLTGGTPKGDATFESTGTRVGPDSLYLLQLCNRLGIQAVRNIGF